MTVNICRNQKKKSKCGKNGNLTYFEAVFNNFCNGVQKNDGYEYNKVKVINAPFLKFGFFTCFGAIAGWVNES